MNNFKLESLDLAITQAEAVDRRLATQQQAGIIKSSAELEVERRNVMNALTPSEPTSKVRKQEGRIESAPVNQTMSEVDLDLQTVFAHQNKIDATTDKHTRLNRSMMQNVQLGIKKAQDDLARLERLVDTGLKAVVETFRDANSFEPRLSFYTERDGAPQTFDSRARLELLQEGLKLPVIYAGNALISPSGVKLGHIQIQKQLAGGLVEPSNPETNLDKAIDTSPDTFWSAMVLTDEPINVELGADYYNLKHGAVCELEIYLDATTTINELSIVPFTEYPLDVVAIRVYQTADDPTEVPLELVAPGKESVRLGSVSSRGPIVYRFPDVVAKRIRILLNQRHYIRTEIQVSQQKQDHLQMLFNATDPNQAAEDISQDLVFRPVALSRVEENPAWAIYHKMAGRQQFDIESLSELMPSGTRSIVKYQYAYGLYDVGVKRHEHHHTGVYVSRPIQVTGDIYTVSLLTTEIHPSVDVPELKDSQVTSIEYYLTTDDAEAGWLPILPEDQDMVRGELLQIDYQNGAYQGQLRFSPQSVTAVRRDGKKMGGSEFGIDGRVIRLNTYDPGISYTVDYKPTADAYEVDLHSTIPVKMADLSFAGTPIDGSLTLPVFPYVDTSLLNQQTEAWDPSVLAGFAPMVVSLVFPDGSRLDQPIQLGEAGKTISNRSNYFFPNLSYMNAFDPLTQNYEYIIQGNRIRFNTPLAKDVRVLVNFPYLFGALRLKAILRRTLGRFQGLTPVLMDYALKLQTSH